jgi:hypothetical protein
VRARTPITAIALVLSLALASCGDDDTTTGDTTTDDTTGATADGATDDGATDDGIDVDATDDGATGDATDDGTGAAPGGPTGSGTLTVGGESYDFEVFHCGLGEEQTANPDVAFSLAGEGDDGLQVNATSVEVDGVGRMDSISAFRGDLMDPDLNWQGVHGPDGFQDMEFLEIDGNQVSATAMFFDERGDGASEEPEEGTFEATCP